ncbi:flavodoxin [Trichlorobacter lovleyi]
MKQRTTPCVLESCDFSGKTIVPYCTHEGSGLGRSERDIKRLCPTAKVLSVSGDNRRDG